MHDDLYGHVPQPVRAPASQRRPLTADDVRDRMHDLIAAVRDADAMPFEAAELKKHRAMFPIMAQWLDVLEGERLVRQFEAEVERLHVVA